MSCVAEEGETDVGAFYLVARLCGELPADLTPRRLLQPVARRLGTAGTHTCVMLWRICLLAFAPCLRAQELGPYPPPPSDLGHAKASYESLMRRWARDSSSIHRCLEYPAPARARAAAPG